MSLVNYYFLEKCWTKWPLCWNSPNLPRLTKYYLPFMWPPRPWKLNVLDKSEPISWLLRKPRKTSRLPSQLLARSPIPHHRLPYLCSFASCKSLLNLKKMLFPFIKSGISVSHLRRYSYYICMFEWQYSYCICIHRYLYINWSTHAAKSCCLLYTAAVICSFYYVSLVHSAFVLFTFYACSST